MAEATAGSDRRPLTKVDYVSYAAPAAPLALVGLLIGLWLVVYWDFDALADPRTAPNSEFALLMLACTYSVIPAIFKFVGMPFLWIYPLTEKKLAEVQADSNKRHGIAGS